MKANLKAIKEEAGNRALVRFEDTILEIRIIAYIVGVILVILGIYTADTLLIFTVICLGFITPMVFRDNRRKENITQSVFRWYFSKNKKSHKQVIEDLVKKYQKEAYSWRQRTYWKKLFVYAKIDGFLCSIYSLSQITELNQDADEIAKAIIHEAKQIDEAATLSDDFFPNSVPSLSGEIKNTTWAVITTCLWGKKENLLTEEIERWRSSLQGSIIHELESRMSILRAMNLPDPLAKGVASNQTIKKKG